MKGMPKCVIMSPFFVFAGTPSIVDCGTVWLSCVIELSSRSHIPQDGYLQKSLITVGL